VRRKEELRRHQRLAFSIRGPYRDLFTKAHLATHRSGCAHLTLGSRRRGLGGTEGARTVARAGGDRGSSVDVNLVSLRRLPVGS
jgi:hypothetical protein